MWLVSGVARSCARSLPRAGAPQHRMRGGARRSTSFPPASRGSNPPRAVHGCRRRPHHSRRRRHRPSSGTLAPPARDRSAPNGPIRQAGCGRQPGLDDVPPPSPTARVERVRGRRLDPPRPRAPVCNDIELNVSAGSSVTVQPRAWTRTMTRSSSTPAAHQSTGRSTPRTAPTRPPPGSQARHDHLRVTDVWTVGVARSNVTITVAPAPPADTTRDPATPQRGRSSGSDAPASRPTRPARSRCGARSAHGDDAGPA